ncbi:MAG: nitrite/sulfite reductase [Deltaproteobacteria bacterium]|nr:MAG: nitrite/sulfite reductase [Deltaproteobacteria bacterium]
MIDFQKLRLDGVYRQNDADQLMLRVKAPAGVLSAPQAEAVCSIAELFSNGRLHLTCRGSIELHWLTVDQLPEIFRRLAAVGLTTRGACGGAVRGISCSTSGRPGFGVAQRVARQLHRHFAGNPHFEGLPKKFKIGVEAGYAGARHLIQDLGIVHTGTGSEDERFDVWCAGGLGREPQAAFLLKQAVTAAELLPLAEAVVRVYARHAPAGKRLKFVVRDLGEARVRELIEAAVAPTALPQQSLAGALTVDTGLHLCLPVFAGEIDAAQLRRIALVAAAHGDSTLALTADQDLLLFFTDPAVLERARGELTTHGLLPATAGSVVTCRVCPGSHECRMGLAPTRDVARRLTATLGPQGQALTWAVSGCPNSCSQPQLADVGVVTSKLVKEEDGNRTPRFDLYRRSGEGLGEAVDSGLTLDQLLTEVARLG